MKHGDLIKRRVEDFSEDIELSTMLGDSTDMVDCLETIAQAQRHFSDLRKKIEYALVEHIEATGQDIVYGTTRFYTGTPTRTKRESTHVDIMAAVLKQVDGDLDQLAACLASGAWLPGATRKVLSTEYGAHFTDTRPSVLKRGKLTKKLLRADARDELAPLPEKAVEDYKDGSNDE